MTHSYNLRKALKHDSGDFIVLANPFRKIISTSNRRYTMKSVTVSNDFSIVTNDEDVSTGFQPDVIKVVAKDGDTLAPYKLKIAMKKFKRKYRFLHSQ